MPVRTAKAQWEGNLLKGKGTVALGSGRYTDAYSFGSRFEDGAGGTNPEELIGAAHAGCFSMALAGGLSQAGYTPTAIRTSAEVHIDKVGDGFKITLIKLTCRAQVPGIDAATFAQHAEQTETNCPVSAALAATQITLDAQLETP